MANNQWDHPGSYAIDSNTPIYLTGNYCTSPFAVSGLPANDYDKACFRFAAATAANLTAKDNVTDSTSVAAVAIRGGAVPAYTSGNRSAWSTADVYVYSGTGPIASANERIYNGTGIYTVFTTMSDPSTGNVSFAGDLDRSRHSRPRILRQQVRQHPGRHQRRLQQRHGAGHGDRRSHFALHRAGLHPL